MTLDFNEETHAYTLDGRPVPSVTEIVGLLTAHKLKQGLIFGGMVVFYAVLTLLAYR